MWPCMWQPECDEEKLRLLETRAKERQRQEAGHVPLEPLDEGSRKLLRCGEFPGRRAPGAIARRGP